MGYKPLIRCLYRDLGMVRPREDINSLYWDTTPDKMSLQGLGNGETPGNRAWESHAKSLKIKHGKVSHQNKEWTKQIRRTSFFFLSTVAGTQVADRWWKGLKDYIPKSCPRWLHHGVNTKEHPELEKFVLGYCWRKSLGPLAPHRFLEELCKAAKAMKSF